MTNESSKKRDALFIVKVLEAEGFQARLVGGCVRDELLGLEPADYDIASSAPPSSVEKALAAKHIKTLGFAKAYGTVTALSPSGPCEITTLRTDVKNYGRAAEVKFGANFKDDAKRRDFTINAMSMDSVGTVYDYFGGRKDLATRRLVFVGDPEQRIKEDYLRILRFFRFKVRFALHSDPIALEAIGKCKDGLTGISKERITSEIKVIFSYEEILATLQEMHITGVLRTLFPNDPGLRFATAQQELQPLTPRQRALCRLWHYVHNETRGCLVLTRLDKQLFASFAKADNDLQSTMQQNDLASKLLFLDSIEGPRKLQLLPVVYAFLRYQYHLDAKTLQSVEGLVETDRQFGHRRHSFPIKAKDIVSRYKLSAGPRVGMILRKLYHAYLAGEWEDPEDGIKMAGTLL